MSEKQKSEIAERLGIIARLYGLKLTSLCNQYSIPFSSLYSYNADRLSKSVQKKLIELCGDYYINFEWLVSGYGNPLNDLPCDFLTLANVDLNDIGTLRRYIRNSARNRFWSSLEEYDLWLSKYAGKIFSFLNTYRKELEKFKNIVQEYFLYGLDGLSFKSKRKISFYVPAPEITNLFHLDDRRLNLREFWEVYIKGEIGKANNPDAPFRRAYQELTNVILFDTKVPNFRQLPNRPTLCEKCKKVICPYEIRKKSGKCPYCENQIFDFTSWKYKIIL